MTPDNAERLGQLADQLDACLYSAKMPLPPALHIGALSDKIREARDVIASVIRDETGEDPWATNPLSG